jgi:hypothetical protein
MARALELVEHAVAVGGSARAHRLLAEMRLLSPFPEMRSPVDALASARAAVTMAPEDPDNLAVLAQALALTGRPKEAVRTIEQALHSDAAPPDWHRQVAGPAGSGPNGKPVKIVSAGSSRWWWPADPHTASTRPAFRAPKVS